MTCKYLAQRLEKQQEMAKEFLQELCLHLLRAALKIFDHIVARTKHTKRILSQQSQSDIRFPVSVSVFLRYHGSNKMGKKQLVVSRLAVISCQCAPGSFAIARGHKSGHMVGISST